MGRRLEKGRLGSPCAGSGAVFALQTRANSTSELFVGGGHCPCLASGETEAQEIQGPKPTGGKAEYEPWAVSEARCSLSLLSSRLWP